MKTINILIIITSILVSCSKSKTDLLMIGKEEQLIAIKYNSEVISASPLDIKIIDDNLFLFQGYGDDAAIILDKNKGTQIGSWGRRGSGPGEFTYPIYWDSSSNTCFLYDLNKFIIREYQWNKQNDLVNLTLIGERRFDEKTKSIRSATVLENGNIVASVIYGSNKPLLLLNNQLDSLDCFGSISNIDQDNMDLRSLSGSLSAYKNKFVFAMLDIGYIACYEQLADGKIKKNWEHYIEKPIYKEGKLDISLLKKGFMDVKMTKNHIYCSYIGKKITPENMNICPETILVFNHQGDLIKNFKTDNKIGKMAISTDEKTIYTASYEPDISIIRYNIEL